MTKPMTWMIYFDDAEMKPEVFTGEGGGAAARKRFEELSQSWEVTLFFSESVVDHVLSLATKATKLLCELRGCSGGME